MEGFDILMALLDECDSSDFNNADNIWRTMNTSASTRFGNRRKVITISFRRYVGSSGMIKRLYHEYKARELADGSAYARRYASWEFNNKPGLYEALLPDIEGKPEESACMLASSDDDGYYDSWIKDTDRILNSMRRDRTWIFDFPAPKDDWITVRDSEYAWLDKNGEKRYLDPYNIPISKKGNPKHKYVLTGDPGLGSVHGNGDGYGITLAHREVVERNGKKWARPVIDFSFRFTGRMFPEGEVQMLAVEKLIEKLNNMGYNIAIYSFDGWNCHSLGTKVMTKNGWKNVEFLEEGEIVLGQHGQENYVVASEIREKTPILKITLDNGQIIKSTLNHPYKVKGEWVKASSISVGDRLDHKHEKLWFGSVSSPEWAGVLGYMVAEGDWKGTARFSNSEEEVKQDFVSLLGERFTPTVRDNYIYVPKLGHIMRGFFESGSHKKQVPEDVFKMDSESVAMFLSCLYEGDGNIQIEKPRKGGQKIKVELTTVSERLSEDVQLLLTQFGIKSYRKMYSNKRLNGKKFPYYRITISGREVIKFRDFIGFRSSRKKTKLDAACEVLSHVERKPRFMESAKVISIEETEDTIVNLEVSGDHSYIAENFISHNSVATTQWVARKYPKAIVYSRNLVETRDYSALRDAIFSEVPPSKGKGDVDEGGGIDWPYHPIVYWELKELRVDRKKGKVDHQEHTSKDISDSIAKAVYIITAQWPFSDAFVSTGTEVRQDKAAAQVRQQMERNRSQDMSAVYSQTIGLGRFRR